MKMMINGSNNHTVLIAMYCCIMVHHCILLPYHTIGLSCNMIPSCTNTV